MKSELKRLRTELLMGTKSGNYMDEDEEILPEELEAFKMLSPQIRSLIVDMVNQRVSERR